MFRKKHSIYRVLYYLCYQAPAGELGMHPLWIRGSTVLIYCLLTCIVFIETSAVILTCSFLFMLSFSLWRLSEFSFFISSQQFDYNMCKYDFFLLYPSALLPVLPLFFFPFSSFSSSFFLPLFVFFLLSGFCMWYLWIVIIWLLHQILSC